MYIRAIELTEQTGLNGLDATVQSGRDAINHVVVAEVRKEVVKTNALEIQNHLRPRKETATKKESPSLAIA